MAAQSGNLVVDGGFENGIQGWTLGGATDYTSASNVPHTGSGNFHAGSIGADSILSQTIATTPGQTYTYDFWLANEGDPDNDFTATFAGQHLQSFVNAGPSPYTEYTGQVVATSSSSTLQFTFRQDPSWWDLDDVSISGGSLFTPGADTIDFNHLSDSQISAIKQLASTQGNWDFLYDDLGGNDTITLPPSEYTGLGDSGVTFDTNHVFRLGDGTSTLTYQPSDPSTRVFNVSVGTGTYDIHTTAPLSCTFGTGAAAVALDASGAQPTYASFSGLQAGDSIDIKGIGDCTTWAGYTANDSAGGNVLDLYNGQNLSAVLTFDSSVDVHSLMGLDDGSGGTIVELDPTQNGPDDPSPHGLDWRWIHRNESPGGVLQLAPYVLRSGGGLTVGHGVDFGTGVDQGGFDDFAASYAGDANLDFLDASLGDRGAAASRDLNRAPVDTSIRGEQRSMGVSLTSSQANLLTTDAEKVRLPKLKNAFNAAAGAGSWGALDFYERSVLFDASYVRGLGGLKSSAFWDDMTSGDFGDVEQDIHDMLPNDARRANSEIGELRKSSAAYPALASQVQAPDAPGPLASAAEPASFVYRSGEGPSIGQGQTSGGDLVPTQPARSDAFALAAALQDGPSDADGSVSGTPGHGAPPSTAIAGPLLALHSTHAPFG